MGSRPAAAAWRGKNCLQRRTVLLTDHSDGRTTAQATSENRESSVFSAQSRCTPRLCQSAARSCAQLRKHGAAWRPLAPVRQPSASLQARFKASWAVSGDECARSPARGGCGGAPMSPWLLPRAGSMADGRWRPTPAERNTQARFTGCIYYNGSRRGKLRED